MASQPKYWAVVPAGGSGRRFGGEVPKQYLPLHGRPVIVHTLERLASHPLVRGISVVVAEDDRRWDELQLDLPVPLHRAHGGAERCHSVLNGLDALAHLARPDDWVLVHDAARPCIRTSDISRLVEAVDGYPDGGLLGLPVTDTVKRVDPDRHVQGTMDRSRLWRALTPQMFTFGRLRSALNEAVKSERLVTDDASAIELSGGRPLMVEGSADNIKITHEGDLELAALFMERQEREA